MANSSPTIMCNRISANSAGRGGGISCGAGCSATIAFNHIAENEAPGGGALSMSNGDSTIQDNIIEDNRAEFYGGAICLVSFSQTPLDAPLIIGNIIRRNSTDRHFEPYLGGGGIYCFGISPTIINNLIVENSSCVGAGICCYEMSIPTIENNTIVLNHSSNASGGGGLWLDYYTYLPVIRNCIVWGNGDDLKGFSAKYCLVEDMDDGIGNIHTDPLFATGPLGEYYLSSASPCIDAGSQSAVDAGLSGRTTQEDGSPDTGTVDMGYHYPI
ncbi:MAG: right-handed parallel beta-helix repeat-containing protein [Candidatus Coatesbacteria bacterium]|nr:right-handed parallel beta-helix repeat-containing protein [Candidatus Coatesbacteria bacterium]